MRTYLETPSIKCYQRIRYAATGRQNLIRKFVRMSLNDIIPLVGSFCVHLCCVYTRTCTCMYTLYLQVHTPDLDGTATSTEVVQAVMDRIKQATKWLDRFVCF